MRRIRTTFSLNDLREFIRENQPAAGEEYRTTREWAELWHCTERLALQALRDAKAAGMVTVGQARRERLDGLSQLTVVYRIDVPEANR